MSENVLKVRDDVRPYRFVESDGDESKYKLLDEDASSIVNGANIGDFTVQDLRNRIEPWLTALFQAEHLSVLTGSGLSTAVLGIAGLNTNGNMDAVRFSTFGEQIDAAAEASARKMGRIDSRDGTAKPNIEDQFRVANELIRGLEIQGESEKLESLRSELESKLKEFADSILADEAALAEAEACKRERAFTALTTFLMSFASRPGTRDRVNIFTTNYDRVIEMGAELAGMHLLDRFVGNLTPIFRSSRLNIDMHYNPPGMRGEPRYLEGVARFTKLHGSIDWIQTGDVIRRIGLPFGANNIASFFQAPGLKDSKAYKLMIYPNSAKDVETASYPYVDLFRDFAAAICRPNGVLVTYGYSFGDDHINRVIKDMLTIPSTHLIIISYNDSSGRIMENYNRWGRTSQMSLMIGKALADLSLLTERYLPKPAIDRATFRMAELLRQRMGAESFGQLADADRLRD